MAGKEIAIDCVDEILSANPMEKKEDFLYLGEWEQSNRAIRYWNIVKWYITRIK